MTEYKGKSVPRFLNPTSNIYWIVHGSLFTSTVAYRLYLSRFTVAPKLLATATIFALGANMVKDVYKFDYYHMINPWRPLDLKDHLETSPITRNALEKALKENAIY